MKHEYAHLRLCEDDYDTIAGKLVHDFGFKGEVAIQAIRGGWLWDAFKKSFRRSFLSRLRDLGVEFQIFVVEKKKSVLILGSDRVILAFHIRDQYRKRNITRDQKVSMLLRLAKGEFPDPESSLEIAMEIDALS